MSSIYEKSGERFLSLPSVGKGKARNYLDLYSDVPKILSRRQVDNILAGERGHYERKAARNKSQKPELAKQRPARGRKSTLPKKPRQKNNKTKSGTYMNGSKYYIRDYTLANYREALHWLRYHKSRGALTWFASGVYDFEGQVTVRNIMYGERFTSETALQKAFDFYVEKTLQHRGDGGSASALAGMQFQVIYPSKRTGS